LIPNRSTTQPPTAQVIKMLIVVFIVGYLAIAFEHTIKINKSASALLTGVLCWVLYMFSGVEQHTVVHELQEHLSGTAGILFFLLGAMVIVELIDAHDGFDLVTRRIRTTDKRRLLWFVAAITFFLSAILDNLTTAIVMVSLLRKLIGDAEERLLFAGMVVIAANAGGAWSPIGDVTTTMLWIEGQITTGHVMRTLFIPSIICLLVPLAIVSWRMRGPVSPPERNGDDNLKDCTDAERKWVLAIGMFSILFVPVFKAITHLPPYMGMLFGLGLMWVLTEIIHHGRDEADKHARSAAYALSKVDTPSVLFFLGILLAVSALESNGTLRTLAQWLEQSVGNVTVVGVVIGLVSAVVDNVPLVAAAQGMYPLSQYPTDHFFWQLLAYCAGTGGSILIIGSAAGVAAMSIERINFIWYLRRIALLAALGYFAGVATFLLLW
jgi:Na+/H+ antiporter NhaD/arsenite permease-like protein